MTKLILIHKINKFYSIFWEVLGYDFEPHICNFDDDFLFQVLFDINEALEDYEPNYDAMTKWLYKLKIQILNYREKTTQKILIKIFCVVSAILNIWFAYSCIEILLKTMSDINVFTMIAKFSGLM